VKRKIQCKRSILRLPDLEVAKSAVINSLSCLDAQRGYWHAIDELNCSEPRSTPRLRRPATYPEHVVPSRNSPSKEGR